MARIPLTAGFTPIPEGTQIFKITGVEYKEEFGKMEVHLETAKGQKHTERYNILKASGEPNEGAMNAYSYMARCAMNDFSLEEVDTDEMVGRYIKCEVIHNKVESNKTPGKMLTFIQLGDKEPADGFEEAPKAQAAPTKTPEKKTFDLGSLLG